MPALAPPHRVRKKGRPRRRGAMMVLIAVTFFFLAVTVAFSVNVAFLQLTRTELRTSTDAAARAANEALAREQNADAAREAGLRC